MLSERVLVAREVDTDAPPASLKLADQIDHLERRLVRVALLRTGGKRLAAARLLGISRNGLTMKMERLGIAEPRSGGEPSPAGS
jgi:DNA-binding NtrC family response regulator